MIRPTGRSVPPTKLLFPVFLFFFLLVSIPEDQNYNILFIVRL